MNLTEKLRNRNDELNKRIEELEAVNKEHLAKIKECSNTIEQLTSASPIAVERKKLEKANKIKIGIAITCYVLAVLALLIYIFIPKNFYAIASVVAMATLFIVLGVMHTIKVFSLKSQIAALSTQLVDLDAELNSYRDIQKANYTCIRSNNSTIQNAETEIETNKTKIKWAAYTTNYVFVFVGQKELFKDTFTSARNMIIIDGQDYGYATAPYSKFELSPGLHTIKIEYQPISDGDIYQSQVKQFRVDDSSKFFVATYGYGNGPEFNKLKFEVFTDPRDFFKATHQNEIIP